MNKLLAAATVFCLASGLANAAVQIDTHGFLTAGTVMIDEPDATSDSLINDRVGFEYDSRMGLQFAAKINQKLDFTSQLLARARVEGWDVKSDWAFAEYDINNQISVRAGRIRLPLYLASEYVEVGHAYPWVRPPVEVYRLVPVNTISGVSVPLKANLGGMDVLVQPFAGSLRNRIMSRNLMADVNSENMVGASFDLSNDTVRFHAMAFTGKVDAHVPVPIPLATIPGVGVVTGDVDLPLIQTSDFTAWDVGLSVNWHNIVFMTEYAADNAGIALDDQSGWYATLGYKMGATLPYITYAQRRSDDISDDPKTISFDPAFLSVFKQDQDSISVGLRHNIDRNSAIKFEVQQSSAQDDTCGLIDAGPAGCGGNFPVNGSYTMYSIAYDVMF